MLLGIYHNPLPIFCVYKLVWRRPVSLDSKGRNLPFELKKNLVRKSEVLAYDENRGENVAPPTFPFLCVCVKSNNEKKPKKKKNEAPLSNCPLLWIRKGKRSCVKL
jgi:hypothetical protein